MQLSLTCNMYLIAMHSLTFLGRNRSTMMTQYLESVFIWSDRQKRNVITSDKILSLFSSFSLFHGKKTHTSPLACELVLSETWDRECVDIASGFWEIAVALPLSASLPLSTDPLLAVKSRDLQFLLEYLCLWMSDYLILSFLFLFQTKLNKLNIQSVCGDIESLNSRFIRYLCGIFFFVPW